MKPFLQICLGISVVLCSAALLIHSASPAKADPSTTHLQNSVAGETPASDRYEMSYTDKAEGDHHLMVIDKQTGKINYYEHAYGKGGWYWGLMSSITFQ